MLRGGRGSPSTQSLTLADLLVIGEAWTPNHTAGTCMSLCNWLLSITLTKAREASERANRLQRIKVGGVSSKPPVSPEDMDGLLIKALTKGSCLRNWKHLLTLREKRGSGGITSPPLEGITGT
ncbi:hypothetical protein P167DRAFT_575050 [Morchella conica CCBAS932]|uniref:Uncharacterized protein n=1 Tax=Morchella conica CCBAS932 TaxID=1392247 RepID=A0A3N4KM40_9PEZI|nr:hypothetical protein P167DRAFT_575050 [Morchella conica CCBAS932]